MFQKTLDEIVRYLNTGGFVMWPLMGGTLLLWYSLGYRMYILRRGSPRSVRNLLERYESGRGQPPQGIVDSAVVRGLEVAQRWPDNLRACLNDEFTAFVLYMRRYSALARAIVLVAPLAGLLGTVGGMIEMFDSLGDQTFYSQSGGIAKGISEALFTTQLGLAVAVPGMIVGRILDRHQLHMERELDQIKDILSARAAEAKAGRS